MTSGENRSPRRMIATRAANPPLVATVGDTIVS